MNHPWLPMIEQLAEHSCVDVSEIECMKGLAEKFYAKPEGAFRIGEAIEHIDAQDNIEWTWFTGLVAENSIGRAVAMMNLITSGRNGGPMIGDMVLLDLTTTPPAQMPMSEYKDVLDSPTRSEQTTFGFVHTKDLVAEVF